MLPCKARIAKGSTVAIRDLLPGADGGSGALKPWLGREDSNLRMGESKSPALPLGDAPMAGRETRDGSRANTFRQRRSTERGGAFQPPKAAVCAANFAVAAVERAAVSWKDGKLSPPASSEAPAMTYRAPINDMLLALNHGAGLQSAVEAGHYGDFDAEITAAVLEEAGRFASDVLAPLNRVGDEHGIRLESDKVTTAPGWPDAYQRWAAAGWNAVSGPEAFGGQGLPLAINAACTEIWSASNIAFGLCPLL